MVMHSAIYSAVAAADRLPGCPTCGRYLTSYPDGLRCDRCPSVTLGPIGRLNQITNAATQVDADDLARHCVATDPDLANLYEREARNWQKH